MNNGTDIRLEKKQKIIKRLKRRLLPSVLAGFSLPITLFLYGPFDLYAQNSSELAFSLYDFLLPCILLTLFCGLVLSAIPLFLGKKIYPVYITVLFWASVMFFVQGSYLNFGISALEGDGVGESSVSLAAAIINAAIWILTLAAAIFLVVAFKKVRRKLRFIVSFGLALVLIMEATGVVAVSLSGDVYSRKNAEVISSNASGMPKLLTTDGLTTLSENRNVVVFIVDRFDAKYYKRAASQYPELLSELEGFTYYSDYTTLYARTYPSVVSILTEHENDYSESREDYMETAYENADSLKFMKESGYSVGIYSDSYYTYINASSMQDFTDNITAYTDYEITDRASLFGSMLAFSMYRYLPLSLKWTVSDMSTETFSDYVEFKSDDGQDKYVTDNNVVYKQVTETDFTLSDEYGRLNFIHIEGCHAPSEYDENFVKLDESVYNVDIGIKQSFKIINRYLLEMKRLGVYENSTVIITGDHANAERDKTPVEGARVTTLLVKESGKSAGEIAVNNAQACQYDLWATVFSSEGLKPPHENKGTAVFLLDENAERERKYVFHRYIDKDNAEELVYKIRGNANEFSNWELVSSKNIRGIYN